MSETSTRFCNIHLGPGCGDEAYDAMFLLNRLTGINWSVEYDEEVAAVLGHCSAGFEELVEEGVTEEEVTEDLQEALRERWPAVRVWFTDEEV